MSRKVISLTPNTDLIFGHDHALGNFVQITDARYAASAEDKQGEGFVLDWDEAFGFGINKIGATEQDFESFEKLIELTNTYCKQFETNSLSQANSAG